MMNNIHHLPVVVVVEHTSVVVVDNILVVVVDLVDSNPLVVDLVDSNWTRDMVVSIKAYRSWEVAGVAWNGVIDKGYCSL